MYYDEPLLINAELRRISLDMIFKITKLALICSISAFVAVVLVDPGDHMLYLKLPLLLISLSIWAIRVAFGMVDPGGPKIWATVLLFAVILPGMASVVSLLGNTLPVGDVRFQLMKEGSVILLLLALSSEGIDLTRHIIRWSLAIALFTIFLAVLSLTAPLVFVVVGNYIMEKGNAFIGPRNLIGLGIGSFYYKSVGILVFPVAYYLQNALDRPRNIISILQLLVFITAILCTDSRAAVLGAFIVFAVLVFLKLRQAIGIEVALSILFIVLALPAGYFATFLQSSESSNEVKIGHIHSYAAEYENHPTYLIWSNCFYLSGLRIIAGKQRQLVLGRILFRLPIRSLNRSLINMLDGIHGCQLDMGSCLNKQKQSKCGGVGEALKWTVERVTASCKA
ncbi:MAG: hypothetical protein ABR991_12020 [Terracidiphilus sp.]